MKCPICNSTLVDDTGFLRCPHRVPHAFHDASSPHFWLTKMNAHNCAWEIHFKHNGLVHRISCYPEANLTEDFVCAVETSKHDRIFDTLCRLPPIFLKEMTLERAHEIIDKIYKLKAFL